MCEKKAKLKKKKLRVYAHQQPPWHDFSKMIINLFYSIENRIIHESDNS
jgi:hypothetical protein